MLTLTLDHINGISNDNRIENLRLLCPNCHSQTPSFAGKRHKKIYYCSKCGRIRKSKNALLCVPCSNKAKGKVLIRPSKEDLLIKIKKFGYRGTGKIYGVSDNTIRKWYENRDSTSCP